MIDRRTALRLVGPVPHTTTELYRAYAGLGPDDNLTVSHRRARKRLGRTLEHLAREGKVIRDVAPGDPHPIIYFKALAATQPATDPAAPETDVDDGR